MQNQTPIEAIFLCVCRVAWGEICESTYAQRQSWCSTNIEIVHMDMAKYRGLDLPQSALVDILLTLSPCESCGLERPCAAHRKACNVFAYYAEHGRFNHAKPRMPNRMIYRRLFQD